MQYLSLGTNNLYQDLFQNIKNGNGFKPFGGLWATKHNVNYDNYNDWVDFISRNISVLFYLYRNNPFNIPACLITLKEDAKIYNVTNQENLNNLKYSFPDGNGWIDFVKMSQYYDGIFFDINSLWHSLDDEDLQKISKFDVSSLILYNINCISYYQEAQVEIEPFDFEFEREASGYKIIIKDEKKSIVPQDDKRKILVDTLKKYIIDSKVSSDFGGIESVKNVYQKEIEEALSDISKQDKETLLIRKAFLSI